MTYALLLAISTLTLMTADATGTWTGTLTPDSDGQARPAYLVLKQEGDKLTGTGGGSAEEQIPIQNGKVDNGTLTFELNTGSFVMSFRVKQQGDEISGDVRRERDGKIQTAKLAVKRTP